jgi:hypothetical protein
MKRSRATKEEEESAEMAEMAEMARKAAAVGAASAAAAGAGPAYMARQARQARMMGPPGTAVLPTVGLAAGLPFLPYKVTRDVGALTAELTVNPAVQPVTLDSLVKLFLMPKFLKNFDGWDLFVNDKRRLAYATISFFKTTDTTNSLNIKITTTSRLVGESFSALAFAFSAQNNSRNTYTFSIDDPVLPEFIAKSLAATQLKNFVSLSAKSKKTVAQFTPPDSVQNIVDMLDQSKPVTEVDVRRVFMRYAACVRELRLLSADGIKRLFYLNYVVATGQNTPKVIFINEDNFNDDKLSIFKESANNLNLKSKSSEYSYTVEGIGANAQQWIANNVFTDDFAIHTVNLTCDFWFEVTFEKGAPGPLSASSRIIQTIAAQAGVTPVVLLSHLS